MEKVLGILIAAYFWHGIDAMAQTAERDSDPWPKRILITNDNGIDDPKLKGLAEAFAKIGETVVVAPDQDRSGSSNYLPSVRKGRLKLSMRDWGPDIQVFAVEGFPADCVFLGLAGIMRDDPPDLVVSGINGGPNLGVDWMFSGTVGAARVAAIAGLPAMAVSGLNDDIPGAVKAASEWVVRLARSQIVRHMKPGRYLTVGLPRLPPDRIKGVRLALRAPLREVPVLEKDTESSDGQTQIWKVTGVRMLQVPIPDSSDSALFGEGINAVTPMAVDEQDYAWFEELGRAGNALPAWGQ